MINLFLQLQSKCRKTQEDLFAFKVALLKYFWDHPFYFDVRSSLPDILERFSINHIMSLWAGTKIELIEETPSLLDEEELSMILALLNGNNLFKGYSPIILSEIYEEVYLDESNEVIGIADVMSEVMRKSVRGSDRFLLLKINGGRLLSHAYDALMNLYFKDTSSDAIEVIHNKIIDHHLFGFDVNPISITVATIVLALKYKKCRICKNLSYITSYEKLHSLPEHDFNWVVHDLYGAYDKDKIVDEEHILTKTFQYAEDMLTTHGHLLVSFDKRFQDDPSCRELRKNILDAYNIEHVFFFDDIRTQRVQPAIYSLHHNESHMNHLIEIRRLLLHKKQDCFHRILFDHEAFRMKQDDLNDNKFIYKDMREHDIVFQIESRCTLMLDDILDFHQGLITGYDKAFVVQGDSLIYADCIDECGVPWIKGKHITDKINFYGQYLLYTNDLHNIDDYPHTKIRLELYRKVLQKRRECEKGIRQWYELQWGREKKFFLHPKIIFPSVSSQNRFMLDDQGYFFGADISAATIKEEFRGQIDLTKIILILNSAIYNRYVLSVIKLISKNRYAYYPNELKRIMLPPIDIIASFDSEGDIERYFGREETE